MIYDIIIFGGGISGLTIAHELVKKGFKILIVEKDNLYGGFAHSEVEGNIPSEHSWRGYAPFYKNTYQIMKEIPYYNSNVFNNLGIPTNFYLLQDDIKNYKPQPSVVDYLILIYIGSKYLLADKRRNDYYEYNIEPFLKKYLSPDGYNYIINYVTGPGYGMNKNDISMGHLIHFIIIAYIQGYRHTHTHTNNGESYEHTANERWHVMNGPTNDVWIDPWVKYLKQQGVQFMNNSELIKLNYNNKKIISADIRHHNGYTEKLKSKEYVLATNPYNTVDIFKNSNMNNLYNDFDLLTKNTKSKQISFRIGINKQIDYPIQNIAFVMSDSEFNITWYPQEKHWKKQPPIISLWSGTIIDFEKKGKLFNKNAESLNKEQLKQEIVSQILRSKSFQKLIYSNNGFNLTKEDIDYIEVGGDEWKFINNKQEPKNKKWVNNITNEVHRPVQETEFNNLFLSGAHTKTTINIWSMEGAIESGKITSNLILDKYKKEKIIHYKHSDPLFFRLIQKLDNILYMMYLPNIGYLLIVLILLLIVYVIYKVLRSTKKY
jgi:uncharacterized protein with NAD-binding domain and iron-sulfur cluster